MELRVATQDQALLAVIELRCRNTNFDTRIIEMQFNKFNSSEKIFLRLIHHPTGSVRAVSDVTDKYVPMINAITQASLSAAFGKQNRIPVSLNEVEELRIEINVLSEPMLLSGNYVSRKKEIEIGKHGIILEYGLHRSVLLPSYAIEKMLDTTQFLEEAATSAGLQKDYWKQPKVNIYRFRSQSFVEQSPNGKVEIL